MTATSDRSEPARWLPPGAPEALRTFREAGVLAAADVDVAVRLAALHGDGDWRVTLAAALAVRAPRVGHVCVELDRVAAHVVAEAAADEAAETALADRWPNPRDWAEAVAASPLVRVADDAQPEAPPDEAVRAEQGAESGDSGPRGDVAPLVWWRGRLYLDRYWRYEQRLAAALTVRAGDAVPDIDPAQVRTALDALGIGHGAGDGDGDNGDQPDRQRLAVATAALHRLAVITGGPGTGKTTTVAGLLAVLLDLAGDDEPPRIALAAPTGKAAQRLAEAIVEATQRLSLPEDTRARLTATPARTLHRLLRVDPGRPSRFRHDAATPLPADVVVVDEASMVSLPLMAKLVDAVPDHARLVLLGDRDQLASIEAGAVLGDLAGPDAHDAPPRHIPAVADRLTAATGQSVQTATDAPPIRDAITRLTRTHRFGAHTPIGRLATAIRGSGDDPQPAIAELDALAADDQAPVTWAVADAAQPAPADVTARVVGSYEEVARAAAGGDADTALTALEHLRVLCAHRRGPGSVAWWNEHIQQRLAERLDTIPAPTTSQAWYPGRPVLVTENAWDIDLANGDVGVVVADPTDPTAPPRVAFRDSDGGTRRLRPSRLPAHDTTYAMTVHKSQGSQYAHPVVVLPSRDSPICTRELVYTALTRATGALTLVASRDVLQRALARRIQRPSGLEPRLWG